MPAAPHGRRGARGRTGPAAVLVLLLLALSLAPDGARAEIRQLPTITAGKAHLRLVDYINRRRHELVLAPGEHARFRYLDIRLGECRVPRDDPAKDAFAWLDITDSRDGRSIFSGWMIASSPALSAMDHLRFDLWVVSCALPGQQEAAGGNAAARDAATGEAATAGMAGAAPAAGATPGEDTVLRPPPRPFFIPVEEPADG